MLKAKGNSFWCFVSPQNNFSWVGKGRTLDLSLLRQISAMAKYFKYWNFFLTCDYVILTLVPAANIRNRHYRKKRWYYYQNTGIPAMVRWMSKCVRGLPDLLSRTTVWHKYRFEQTWSSWEGPPWAPEHHISFKSFISTR